MNVRDSTLLKLLLDTTHYTPIQDFADELSCSEKTVRTSVKTINSFLASSDFESRIEGKRGNGIRMIGGGTERSRIRAMVEGDAIATRPSLEHFYKGIMLVACEPRTYTMDSLSRRLFTNKQQLKADVRHWQNLLAPFELAISHKGRIDLVGDERAVRFFMMFTLYSLAPLAMKRTVEPEFIGDDAAFIDDVCSGIEEGRGIRISENARRELGFYMKLMVARVRCERTIPRRRDVDVELPAYYEQIRMAFRDRFGVDLSQDELHLLDDLFSCCTWQWSSELMDSFEPSEEACDATERLCRALYDRFGARPDDSLLRPLRILMGSAMTRHERLLSVAGPDEILAKFERMASFLMLTQVFHDDPTLSDVNLFGTDYTRLTVLLLEYFENANLQRPFDVGVVATSGVEQMVYAKQRIERLVPMVNVVGSVTESDVLDADEEGLRGLGKRFDFLVTFDPLPSSFPSVCVSPVIGPQDISHLVASAASVEKGTLELERREPRVFKPLQEDTIRDLYDDLEADDVIDMTPDDFMGCLLANAVTMGTTLVAGIFNKGVRKTTARLYPAKRTYYLMGRALDGMALLLVDEADRDLLLSLTEQFKRLVSGELDLDHALMEFFPE